MHQNLRKDINNVSLAKLYYIEIFTGRYEILKWLKVNND